MSLHVGPPKNEWPLGDSSYMKTSHHGNSGIGIVAFPLENPCVLCAALPPLPVPPVLPSHSCALLSARKETAIATAEKALAAESYANKHNRQVMASNKKPIGSFTDTMDEYETGWGTFKPSRLAAAPTTDSALMGRRPSAGSQAMRDYSWDCTYDLPEQSSLTKRLPSSTSSRTGEQPITGRYTGCHAGVGVDQINGVVIVCGPEAAEYGLEAPKGRYLYSDCTKEGSGVQVNGLDVVYYATGSKVPNHPGMDGQWHGMMMVSGDGKEAKGARNQINGGRIRKLGRNEEEMARVRQYIR